MQITSLLAYQEIVESLGKRQVEVLKALREIEPANNRQISQHMRKPINTITGRIFELRNKGLVVLSKTEIDPITKKKTIFWETQLK